MYVKKISTKVIWLTILRTSFAVRANVCKIITRSVICNEKKIIKIMHFGVCLLTSAKACQKIYKNIYPRERE